MTQAEGGKMKLIFATVVAVALSCTHVVGQNVHVDPAFSIEADGMVWALAVQPDGKILVGGAFTTINGVIRNKLARLNSDGTVDEDFVPEGDVPSAHVRQIVVTSSNI